MLVSSSRQVRDYSLIYVLLAFVVCSTFGYFSTSPTSSLNDDKSCFCELKGSINDCSCNVDTVDHFNNVKIYPRLKSLLVKNYFRFYKVNLQQECPFWPDDSKCAMRFCHVEHCEEKNIPAGLKETVDEVPAFKYSKEGQMLGCADDDFNTELGFLDTSISDHVHKEFAKWAVHDEAEEDFCILDDLQNGAQYVDLLLNPERFTGYKGDSAHRIWKSIYLENCFSASNRTNSFSSFIPQLELRDVCLEQKAFYRLISGLHTSINIHLSSKYLLSDSSDFIHPKGVWGHNLEEFKRRFGASTTMGEGPHWLKNLYFIYLVELRALAKAAPYLRREEYYTGIEDEDREVKLAINDLLNVVEAFPSHFDEHLLFSSGFAAIKLKHDYKEKFRNISKIMDCVGCDKCKLWGKLQTQGLGTALKVLYSEKLEIATEHGLWDNHFTPPDAVFRLKRSEIVALFNAFGRLSNSIYELENFRKLLR